MNRRYFIGGIIAALTVSTANVAMGFNILGNKQNMKAKAFPFTLSNGEWEEKLTPQQYKVLRKGATERSFTSDLNNEKRDGVYHCAGCDHSLYSSKDKFESGTGWPSFTQPISISAVGTKSDNTLFYKRTEVHCANCGGHIGHVFDDGPKPTGLRYCMNGVAMVFKSA